MLGNIIKSKTSRDTDVKAIWRSNFHTITYDIVLIDDNYIWIILKLFFIADLFLN